MRKDVSRREVDGDHSPQIMQKQSSGKSIDLQNVIGNVEAEIQPKNNLSEYFQSQVKQEVVEVPAQTLPSHPVGQIQPQIKNTVDPSSVKELKQHYAAQMKSLQDQLTQEKNLVEQLRR